MSESRCRLPPETFFPPVVPFRPAGLGGLDALAVDDRSRGAGVAPDPFAICHHEGVVHPFKRPSSRHRHS